MHGHSGDHAAEEERDLHLWQTEAGRGGDDEEVAHSLSVYSLVSSLIYCTIYLRLFSDSGNTRIAIWLR